MTLFKQSLHVYWVMKRLLAKLMEQVASEMAELSQGIPNLKRKLRIIQITLEMQDKKMEEIQQLIKDCHPDTKREVEKQTATTVP